MFLQCRLKEKREEGKVWKRNSSLTKAEVGDVDWALLLIRRLNLDGYVHT